MTRADSVHVPTNQGKSTVRILVAAARKEIKRNTTIKYFY